jgi:hypothetical protein
VFRRKADGFGVASCLRLSRMLEVAIVVADREQVGMQHIVGLLLQIAWAEMGLAEVYWLMELT